MKRFDSLYIKYLVKSPIVFYAFLLIFIGVFIFTGLLVKIDVHQSYSAGIEGNVITIVTDSPITLKSDRMYYYNNRNDKVYRAKITDVIIEDNLIQIVLDQNPESLSGEITVEAVIGNQTLLERIFIRAGRG